MSRLHLRRVTGSELDAVVGRLGDEGLPHEDVREGPGRFYLAVVGDRPVGCGGFEVHDRAGLLRSVVVDPPARGAGHGRVLVSALLERLAAEGVEEVWLLTQSAAPFFEALGFERLPRSTAPDGVAASHEFAVACPASAVAMRRSPAGEG